MIDPDQVKKLAKRAAICAVFFLLAVVFFMLRWRSMLIVYVILVTAVMVLAILLQSGRGGGLASLGGLGGDSILGTRSATPIAKATYVMGALFLFICMLISVLGQGTARERPPAGLPRLPPIERPAEQERPETPASAPVPAIPQPGSESRGLPAQP